MKPINLRSCAWMLGALAAFAISVPAQGDTLNMAPTNPVQGNWPALPPSFGDHLIIGLNQTPNPFAIPGIGGALWLDPSWLLVLQGRGGFGPELNPVLKALGTKGLHYQRIGPIDSQTIQFSPVRHAVGSVGFKQLDSEAVCRARGARHVKSVVNGKLAPGWANAPGLKEATPIYRPDVQGVAYFHFRVAGGGQVVVSTGDHDVPVSQWSDTGIPIVDDLQKRAGVQVGKFYRLDSMCWVAISQGQIVAQIGNIPPKIVHDRQKDEFRLGKWNSWGELLKEYSENYRPMIEGAAMHAADLWVSERDPNDDPWGPWSLSFAAGGHAGQRNYDQFQESGCWIGCGAVAWAMLFGWADKRAALGDPAWAHRWGLYRASGLRGADAVAPQWNTNGVRNMIREIRGHVGTFCAFGNGATAPWDMHRADRYLSGRTGTTLSTNYNSLSIHKTDIHDTARDEIIRGKPAIIGTGYYSHYPVAYGFATQSRMVGDWFWRRRVHNNWFYLNMGWGGSSNGWYNTGTWFVGRIFAN